MKNTIKIILLFTLSLSLNAQTTSLKKGTKAYENLNYVDAIKTYENLAKDGYKSVDLFQKLGNSYYFNAKLKEANKWYTQLFDLKEKVEPEYYYRYSQTLKANEEYEKANSYLDQFYALSSIDLRGNIYNNQKNYQEVIAKNSGRFEIKNTTINSKLSDYGTAIYGDLLIFSTSRDSIGFTKVLSKWTSHSFTNLYSAKINEDGSLEKPEKFSRTMNSKFHEATPIFTKDLKTVYFTRNNFNNGKIGKDSKQIILLKLYKATLVNDKWGDIKELPFNSDLYSVAHPALSPDEKTLYFASNMPGTKGESDIFKVAINEDGTFGKPTNLTGKINTEGRETFPYITKENELFFASDGHQGLGGLDIFATKLNEQGEAGEIINIGAPANGPMDDFAFIIDNATKVGFFSSNRKGGLGFDDIYTFKETQTLVLECKQTLEGIVTNSENNQVMADAKITLFDDKFNKLQESTSDSNGFYTFDVECGKKYYVRAEKEDFETTESSVTVPETSGKTSLPLTTSLKIKEIKVGTDLAKTFDIKIIYFDLDKSKIRPDAAIELAKIKDVLEQNPSIKIDVRSHTDCRQTARYNEALSDRRAKSTIAWLVSKGIAKSRLTGKGYGESQLVNDCGCEPTNASSCSEAEHQLNRRSEFIIVE